nr:MAG TPA_asm: hypothetical protein [Caudoviricetes sp.]DAM99709.1 MAG TPA: hypothetical protein [Caudoviricetes sp.]
MLWEHIKCTKIWEHICIIWQLKLWEHKCIITS